MNQLLWVGAGDLAMRSLPYLPSPHWHSTALHRHPRSTPFQHSLYADLTQADTLQAIPQHLSHIVYSPTPSERSKQAYAAIYDTGLTHLLQHINVDQLQQFIFISSTAVYGASPSAQDECSALNPSAFNGDYLCQAERFLAQTLGDKLTIIRFSGLYGPDRQQIFKRLRAQQVVVNPANDNYANRIHIEDAARVCAHVLQLPNPANCYVATDSTPVPQVALYQHLAQLLAAPAPRIEATQAYESKHFSNQRLLRSGFAFLHPNTIEGYSSLFD